MEIDKTARRILGALLEKRWTTPEQYPLTLNALVAACNQKSNRDPEMQLEEFLVEGCLYQLRLAELVMVVEREAGRAVRYAERLSEKLDLSRQQQAIVAELMLRGPQTAPELLRRCERMAHFENEGQVEELLRGMASMGWTHLLPRQSGQRHARWRHLFAPAGEEDEASGSAPSLPKQGLESIEIVPGPVPDLQSFMESKLEPGEQLGRDPITALRNELVALREEVAELRARVARLEGQDGITR